MKYRKAITIIGLVFIQANIWCYAMTVDEAIEKLKTYRFGTNNEALEFLRETAVRSHSDAALRKKLNECLTLVLESDAAYDAKQFACRQLALTATDEHIPVLAKHLTDEKMSHIALYVLTHIDSPEVDKALLSAMDKSSGSAKLGIINMLGNRRCSEAVRALGQLAASADKQASTEAVRALGRIGNESAAGILLMLFADDKHTEKDIIAEACLECADEFLKKMQNRAAADLYKAVFTSGSPAHIRAAALRGISQTPGEQAGPFVEQSLKSDDKDLYGMAVVIIREATDKKTAEMITAGLAGFQPEIQALLINALSARKDGAGVNIIKQACQSNNVTVRCAALRALGKVGDESGVSLLVERSSQGDDAEKEAAMESLISLRGQNINTALSELLLKSEQAGQVAICRALLERNAVEATPALIKVTQTADRSVRAESLKALRGLAGQGDIAALIDLIFIVEPAQADQVGKTLSAVARRHTVEKQCTESILSKLEQAGNEKQQIALLMTLGGLGNEPALSVLRRSLQDKNSNIQNAAIKALSSWPDIAAADDLLKVAQSSSNLTHRTLALRGYIDLVNASELSAAQKLEHYETAMEFANQDSEKRKVLSVIARLDTIEAFRMSISRLDEPSLKNEAAQAACIIAEKIYTTIGHQIKGDLTKIMDAGVGESTNQQAQEILENINKANLYIMDWEVSGPYTQQGRNYNELFDIPFAPEIAGGKDAKWRTMPVDTDSSHPFYLDLLKALNGGEQRVAYLRAKLQWPREEPVKLRIGSDDGNKVWVNGKLVHANNVARPFTADQDSATATFNKGDNIILMKITQNNLPWGASLGIEQIKKPE